MGFKDLNRYPLQKARYDKYKAWLDSTPLERQQKFAAVTDESRRAVAERESGYVSPFGTAGATKIYLPTRLIKSGQAGQGSSVAEALRTVIAPYVTTNAEFALLTTPLEINAKKFRFAKLTFTAVAPGTVKKPSRITGVEYKKPDVDSVTSPFGQTTGGQPYDGAVLGIKGQTAFAAFLAGNSGKNRVRFTPEG
ncbi:hypothetical protein [Nostoc sp.]|uniref:hypothetical protein n=1 Tax=Nostoc sp. TaxID=1180 RepID=UPI002FFBD1C4